MISVIVPTMWKANKFFFTMLPHVLDSEFVGEVIIIDNNSKERPDHEILKHEKVIFSDPGRNLFFNPSLNLGVQIAENDLLCFMNDDIVFEARVFQFICENYNKELMGMIYPHPRFFNRIDDPSKRPTQFELVESIKTMDGFGCCMFIHKDNYYEIPSELIHHFGDQFLHKMQLKAGRKNYYLYNWYAMTPMRVTTNQVPEVLDVIANDWSLYQEVYRKYGIDGTYVGGCEV